MTVILGDLLSNKNDNLTGGSSADEIYGGRGYDVIHGGGGNDYIESGEGFPLPGSDTVYGEGGDDEIHMGGNASGNFADGGSGNDLIIGGDMVDEIHGGIGDDELHTGMSGNIGEEVVDELYGDAGDDILVLTDGAISGGTVILDGGADDDTFYISYGFDVRLIGGTGNDTFIADDQGFDYGYNHFDGGSGTDVIVALSDGAHLGVSSLESIEGISSLGFDDFQLWLEPEEQSASNGVTIDFSQTLVEGVVLIQGTSHDDTVTMAGSNSTDLIDRASDDTLDGGSGNDYLSGGFGTDILTGGAGNDLLIGGDDGDGFLFQGGDDSDVIADFSLGEDLIFLANLSGFDDFADVQAAMTDVAGDTVIDFGNGDILTIAGVTSSSFIDFDFQFIA